MGFPFFIIFIALAHHFSYALAETGDRGLSIRWKREIGTETYTRGITEKGRTTHIQAYNGFLYALDERGNKRWRVKTDLYENAFKKFNGVLYTGARDGYLLAINGDSGQELWRYKAEGSINGAPVIAGDLILLAHQAEFFMPLILKQVLKSGHTGQRAGYHPLLQLARIR